jgi:predicted AAA+ superfamily ATPase
LEDYCALLFSKEFSSGEKFYYDYSKGGADFVVRFENNDELVMEVGYNKKKISQVKKTMEKSSKRLKYGLVIGGDELELIGNNIVKVPVDYFLLI